MDARALEQGLIGFDSAARIWQMRFSELLYQVPLLSPLCLNGVGRLTKENTAVGKVDLGEKLTCSSCGARYYDLNKTPALCPKCGAENERPKTFRTKKAEPAAPKPDKESAPPKAVKSDDPDAIEDLEDIETDDDDDDDLIADDASLDDEDDDDVDSVIGPIEKGDETAG